MPLHDILLGIVLFFYIAASVLLHVYGLNCYVLILLYLRSHRRRMREERELRDRFAREVRDEDLPVVTTQLPIYNERNVVERLVRAVAAFDYPRDKHEIQVLDDSTDETREVAAELVAELRAAGHDVHHIHREDRSGYKAGALAFGLEQARGEYLAIFDADFVPPPHFLRRTLPFLVEDPRCGWVQTRWGHRNRGFSLLTELQSIGIDGHFVVEQSARAWSGLCFNFNGTAGVWRRRAIEDAGGWKADTLTEDLDLSYRVILAGWRPRYLLDEVTPAELPTNINALKSQQSRWAKGSIQTALKLLPVVWRHPELGWFKRVQATLHLTHYLIHPLILVITLLVLPLILLVHVRFISVYAAPLILVMFLALFGPSTLYLFSQWISGGSVRRTLWHLPVLMAMGIGLAVNNTRAVLGALRHRPSEFVRTPKLGVSAESRASVGASAGSGRCKQYRQPLSRFYLLEIFMGAWALVSFLGSIGMVGTLAGPFLLVQAVGFTSVGILSLLHDRAARRG